MEITKELSIIIVHFGRGKEVYKCLENLNQVKTKLKNAEFIFVDNNEKTSLKLRRFIYNHKWIRYIKSPKNLGWGGGRNFGVKYATGRYYLFLDSDTTIDYESVAKLYKFIKHKRKVGLVSPRLINISGKYHGNTTLELTPLRGIFFLSLINKYFPRINIIQDYLMTGYDRKSTKKVDVAQLAVFIISKTAYDSIGGFDENLFLYFEENDVSSSLRKNGWYIYLVPSAKAIHLESQGTPKSSQKVRNVFSRSRYYYFKKHYGILSAITVNLFANISKNLVTLTVVVLIGILLRFYRFYPNLILNGEMGTDYMNVWNMLHGTRNFLVGPRTSHEWFFISPIAYWIYAVLLLVWNYSPVVVNIFWGIIGSFSVIICYFIVRRLFDDKVAMISSFLLALSPVWVDSTRASRYNIVAAILFLPYLLYLKNSIEDKGKSLFKLGLILGISMSFFPSPILLIPAVIVSFIIYRVKPKFKYIFYSILGFLIPNIAFIVYEIGNKFAITTQLLAWIPYRILGFFGLYQKNKVDNIVLSQNFNSIYKFFAESFIGYTGIVSTVLFILIGAASLYLLIKFRKDFKKEISFYLLIINLVVCYLGLFIHGNPPQHYYYVIFPIPAILVAFILTKLINNKFVIIFSTLLLGLMGIAGLVKASWFFSDRLPVDYTVRPVPYTTQLDIVDKILKDSNGVEFSLARIGLNDQFENNFANNYRYLLTARGAKVVNEAELRYTIVEGENNYQQIKGDMFFSENEVYVVKNIQ